jgi:hypothetical protein
MLGTVIEPGDAGVQAAYWLRCYDFNDGHSRDEAHLRGLYYCARFYWQQSVTPT